MVMFFKNELLLKFYQNMVIMKRNPILVGNLNYLGWLSEINYNDSWIVDLDDK